MTFSNVQRLVLIFSSLLIGVTSLTTPQLRALHACFGGDPHERENAPKMQDAASGGTISSLRHVAHPTEF